MRVYAGISDVTQLSVQLDFTVGKPPHISKMFYNTGWRGKSHKSIMRWSHFVGQFGGAVKVYSVV